jgi:hypothetical protein
VLGITGVLMVLAGAFLVHNRLDHRRDRAVRPHDHPRDRPVRARAQATDRRAETDPTSTPYAETAGRTNTYGVITTAVVLVIVVLMVTKPF